MYIDKNGKKWFKGNLHLHTTESDGKLSPEEAYKLYKKNGYDFIACTDHWKLSPAGDFNGMLLLPGIEYNIGENSKDGIYHIVALGMEKIPDISKDNSAQEIIDAIHDAGGMEIYAHPAWSLNTSEQLMKLKDVDMTEIYNSVSGLPYNARPYSGLILDVIAANGIFWKLGASDDTHFYENEACMSYIMVQAEKCTREVLFEAVEKGSFYGTQGPELNVLYKDGKITVDCSPVSEIVYYTDSVWSPHRSDTGKNLTHGEYIPLENETFVRVEIKASDGKYAWSQYIKINK